MQAEVLDMDAGFFEDFAGGAFLNRLAVFHVAAGDIPKAFAGFDGAFGEEDFAAPDREAAGDDIRVLVVDGIAGIADEAKMGVAFDFLENNGMGAVGAEFHKALVL